MHGLPCAAMFVFHRIYNAVQDFECLVAHRCASSRMLRRGRQLGNREQHVQPRIEQITERFRLGCERLRQRCCRLVEAERHACSCRRHCESACDCSCGFDHR